ncbi:RagB/SusD family nutrient uptake outer membrane protein [Alkalitalea saponilacus]|uniref:Starch-binding associating with outer membrane n=1 Tax=Alkalitalea saponilacus TaxID=889453 RepID=A0A1T5A905_9BACT|nr:RagB/SusD family nutrient uptake outer membrane protein [Alkalitalea saponilacus]ASB48788.1 RagB/SusD family nutrient uptake outer membrane protein [Alkalitalea saponilacus]SKB31474.1 Starch-binding associating with outer membrane [Alkalitalea saponilacus]
MKKSNKISLIALLALFFIAQTSCDDMFEPAIENHKEESDLLNMPLWAAGLLGHVYIGNPLASWQITDVATDNAVINDPNSGLRAMATGSWRANNNPMDRWQNLRSAWNYLNVVLDIADDVNWAADPLVAEMYRDRFKGDAYGMRALLMHHLLLHHAGPGPDGQLLGIPIITEPETVTSEFNLPRNTFQECIDFLIADVNRAIGLLPDDYGDISQNSLVPAKYANMGVTASQYSRVFGDHAKNRMSARIARAIHAQAALLAASPAYSAGSTITWEYAADRMAEVLAGLGANPVNEVDPLGNLWYANNNEIRDFDAGFNPREILWRGNKEQNLGLEQDNYPPTLFGRGRVNPTQNFVDAFPMLNGYPIDDPNSNYNPNDPYANRDPRLAQIVIYNGTTAGHTNAVINTAADAEGNNALNRVATSTRTGYYLRKLLNHTVNANPDNEAGGWRYRAFMRYTEFFLGYAEAANEAWGPTGTGAHGYSAYDVVRAIRQRAGIGVNGSDPYLDSAMGDRDKMRELIRNERRIELSFENFRFWDLRRWKEDLTEPAMGMRIQGGNYTVIPMVESRAYQNHMYYGPIPFSEVTKYDNLFQNQGW